MQDFALKVFRVHLHLQGYHNCTLIRRTNTESKNKFASKVVPLVEKEGEIVYERYLMRKVELMLRKKAESSASSSSDQQWSTAYTDWMNGRIVPQNNMSDYPRIQRIRSEILSIREDIDQNGLNT